MIFNRPTPHQIVREFCAARQISHARILGTERTWDIAHPRQDLMLELREKTRLSTSGIARVLNRKDHTTVLHGLRRAKQRREQATAAACQGGGDAGV